MATAPNLARDETLTALEGLRGICSILIIVGHFFTRYAPVAADEWPAACIEYFQPVSLFFVLSGLVLAKVYKNEDVSHSPARQRFWWKRVARLVPVYFCTLLLDLPNTLHYSTDATFTWVGAVLSVTGLQSLTLYGIELNSPSWQVSAFMFCYILFPFIQQRLKDKATSTLFCIAFLCYVVPLIAMVIFVAMELPGGVIHNWAPARVPQFVLGLMTGNWIFTTPDTVDGPIQRPPPKVPAWLLSDTLTFLMLALFVFCGVLGQVLGPGFWWTFMLLSEFALLPLHCLWLASLCAVGPDSRGLAVRALSGRIPKYLGEVSLSTYLLHYPLLSLYSAVKVGHWPELQNRDRQAYVGTDTLVDGPFVLEVWELVPALAMIVCASQLVYELIEKPARIHLDRCMRKR